ncbi:hypothetical protein QTJ16_001408 [Diplocarpon rosae]|uniref:Uncharacterized protein n=1 Tax=Diplocarpon rosae TaxID=946125 RepID=A0AAD9WHH6_9HELO|nr:hypothetical protein QTJ16_001408 [Diplocarpon rosae]PBP24760.1 hypothetical protein BUE80_DR004295 [Diplocarpon rosae]
MCHQIIEVFKCGHSSSSQDVCCMKLTIDCQGVFLREELVQVKGLCVPCGSAAEMKRVDRQQASKGEDEGYCS